MTRADIINGLGIGHLSHRALQASKRLGTTETSLKMDEALDNDDRSATSEGVEEEEDDDAKADNVDDRSDSSADEEGTGTDEQEDDLSTCGMGVPCRASDVGGFYSALCSLGTGVTVGTKVSFIASVS